MGSDKLSMGSDKHRFDISWPSLIAGLDCWTGLLDPTKLPEKSDDASVAHGTASKAEV